MGATDTGRGVWPLALAALRVNVGPVPMAMALLLLPQVVPRLLGSFGFGSMTAPLLLAGVGVVLLLGRLMQPALMLLGPMPLVALVMVPVQILGLALTVAALAKVYAETVPPDWLPHDRRVAEVFD